MVDGFKSVVPYEYEPIGPSRLNAAKVSYGFVQAR
jgi:hypothetical protein